MNTKSTSELVRELRDRTGSGIVDCMNALKETHNNLDKALVWLQEKGKSKAAKKGGVVATEGVVGAVVTDAKLVLYEINSQTDFVVANERFKKLVHDVEEALRTHEFHSVEEANAVVAHGKSIADMCLEATAIIGEKIVLRRALVIKLKHGEVVGAYVHVNKRIAAALIIKGGSSEVARNVAMHIASMNPQFLDDRHVPAETVAKARRAIETSPQLAGKPDAIRENIIKGMLRKHLAELTLVDQEFVMEKMPVSTYLANHKAIAEAMVRFEVGEGLEKVSSNFADEVKAQMKDAQK